MPFINRGSVLLFLVCWEILSWVCWIVFLYFLRQLYSYLLCFVNMVNYTWFSSICPTFHSHDKPHFVIIWYHFQILLNLICYYFSKDYVLYVHGSHNGLFFFLSFIVISLSGFDVWVLLDSQNELASVPSSFSSERIYIRLIVILSLVLDKIKQWSHLAWNICGSFICRFN